MRNRRFEPRCARTGDSSGRGLTTGQLEKISEPVQYYVVTRILGSEKMDIVPGQGHILEIPQSDLTGWVASRRPVIQP